MFHRGRLICLISSGKRERTIGRFLLKALEPAYVSWNILVPKNDLLCLSFRGDSVTDFKDFSLNSVQLGIDGGLFPPLRHPWTSIHSIIASYASIDEWFTRQSMKCDFSYQRHTLSSQFAPFFLKSQETAVHQIRVQPELGCALFSVTPTLPPRRWLPRW